uniref:Uncharacterized protein n=1 Tax=Anguilla anguilla TaxID=7936 RepID=A0A0E9T508_ANGAN
MLYLSYTHAQPLICIVLSPAHTSVPISTTGFERYTVLLVTLRLIFKLLCLNKNSVL